MKNDSNKITGLSIKAVQLNAMNDGEEAKVERISLQDECGDSLWDEVLKRQEALLALKKDASVRSDANPVKK